MLKIVPLALRIVVVVSVALSKSPVGMTLPSEARTVTDGLLQDMQNRWYMFSGAMHPMLGFRKVEEAGERFDQGLQELARITSQEAAAAARSDEGKDIRAKLIMIAVDRARRPEVYAEIDRRYVHFSVSREMRAAVAPFPEDTHVQEKYRLAWEYWLLWPGFDSLPGHADEGVLYAIQRIGSPASLISLEHCYRLTCRKVASPRQVCKSQVVLLRSVVAFETYDGLRALLCCLAASEGLPYESDRDYRLGWAWYDGGPRRHVQHLLNKPRTRSRWQELLANLDRSTLPEAQLRILDHLQRGMQEGADLTTRQTTRLLLQLATRPTSKPATQAASQP
jgi:hypothetical protein